MWGRGREGDMGLSNKIINVKGARLNENQKGF
jgi:hypothetical protein